MFFPSRLVMFARETTFTFRPFSEQLTPWSVVRHDSLKKKSRAKYVFKTLPATVVPQRAAMFQKDWSIPLTTSFCLIAFINMGWVPTGIDRGIAAPKKKKNSSALLHHHHCQVHHGAKKKVGCLLT